MDGTGSMPCYGCSPGSRCEVSSAERFRAARACFPISMPRFEPEYEQYCDEANVIARLPEGAGRHEDVAAFCKKLEELRIKGRIDQQSHRALVAIANLVNDPRAHHAFEEDVIDVPRQGQVPYRHVSVHHGSAYHAHGNHGSMRRPA